jgi:hypothetical protein
MPYHHSSWDEGNVVAYVYQKMFSSFSSSFIINRESSCSSIPLLDIVDTSGFHQFFEDTSHTMVGHIPRISFDLTSLSQVDSYLKYEYKEAFQDNEALQFTSMVMPGIHSFVLSLGMNNFTSMNIPLTSTLYTNYVHGSNLICYFPLNSLHQFYDSSEIFYHIIEAWLERSYIDIFSMNYHYDISNIVDRVYRVLIFHIFTLFLFQVL